MAKYMERQSRGYKARIVEGAFVLALSGGVLPFGARAASPDTVGVARNHPLDELVVTGTRNETDVRHLPMTVSVIGRDLIESANNPSLLPVLTEQVPGLFTTARGVMGYGVSDGAAGAISLRGLGGGSGRLMVLIDGHPQYMGLFGHPIADACQSFLAERVEVLRGPASVLYGSNAMGGVVNIVTRKMEVDGVKTHANVGYGSYNTLQTEVTNRVRKGRFTSIVSASYNRTDGHREDMDFGQYGGYAKLGYGLAESWNLWGDVNVTHFNAAYPGSVSAPVLDAYQRITRGMASFALENHYGRTSGALSFFYNWGRHKIDDGYQPGEGESPLDYRFNSKDNMMGLSWYQSAQLFGGNRLTLGVDWYRLGGDAWNEYISGERAGEEQAVAGMPHTEHEVAGYIDFRQDFSTWVSFGGGLRVDHHTQAGTEWIPQAGFSFHLPVSAELKLSAGKGFRYPAIREMFMWGVANPDLEAERMWNYELAYSQKLMNGRLSYGINLYYIDADNLITVDVVDGRRMNVNTGEMENAGVEAQIAYRFSQAWSADANYSYLHMENPVVAAPGHKFYAGVGYGKGEWRFSTGLQYVGGLYTETGDNPQTEDFLLWNFRASFQAAPWLGLWIRGENLLAQEYEINAGYPMPHTTVMAGINVDF